MKSFSKLLLTTLAFSFAVSCSVEEPHTGSYEVTSVKNLDGTLLEEAIFYLDGDSLGIFSIPHSIENLTVGSHTLNIRETALNTTLINSTFSVEPDLKITKDFVVRLGTLSISATNSETSEEIEDVSIYINNELITSKPPTTLLLLEGNYSVKLQKDEFVHWEENFALSADEPINYTANLTPGFLTSALVEDFSNTSCIPCVDANIFLYEILDEDETDRLYGIKYAVSWPQVTDPFFQANPSENASRYSFYNVLQAPTTYVNGNTSPNPQSKSDILTAIGEKQNIVSPLGIKVTSELNGSNLKVDANLKLIKSITADDWRLFFVMIETYEDFEEPPGSNGETFFRDVMRDMQPDGIGLPITFEIGVEQTHTYTFDTSSFDVDELECIVFVQSQSTKEILQVASTHRVNHN